MPETKASFLRWQDGMVGMSHLRSVALYPNRQFLSDQLVWFLTLSYIQGKFDLFPFFFFFYLSPLPLLFSSSTVNPNNRTHVAPSPLFSESWTLPPSLFLFPSFFPFSRLHAISVCFAIAVFPARFRIATEQNNYIFIYVQCKMNAHFFMEQTFRTLTSD